jgi:hypothetical protein
MDTLGAEALQKLLALLNALLPDDLAPRPALTLIPLRISPTGLGGFVGISDVPAGDLYGRRVQARLLVAVSAASLSALEQAIASVLANFVGADAAALRIQGLMTLSLAEVGPLPTDSSGTVERTLTFSVTYDFVKMPEEDAGVVHEIHLLLKDPDDPTPLLHDKRTIEETVIQDS